MLPTVIYIAGYGRSGSTLLDILLGSHADCVSLGEVSNLPVFIAKNDESCTCGSLLKECNVWKGVDEIIESENERGMEELRRASQKLENWSGIFRLLADRRAQKLKAVYSSSWGSILESAARGHSHVVDSSQTTYPVAWRPLALSRLVGADIKLIHLVRDSQAVTASKIAGNNRKLAKGLPAQERYAGLRAIVGWLAANLCAMVTGRILSDDKYLVLSYEELVESPDKVFQTLERFLGLDFRTVRESIAKGDYIPVGHLVAGNRMARSGQVKLKRSKQPIKLGIGYRLLNAIFASGLQWYLSRLMKR